MLSGAHALNGLLSVYLRGRGQDDGLKARPCQSFLLISCPMWNAVLFGDCPRGFGRPPVDADDLGILDPFKPVEMLLPKRALPNHTNLHRLLLDPPALAKRLAS